MALRDVTLIGEGNVTSRVNIIRWKSIKGLIIVIIAILLVAATITGIVVLHSNAGKSGQSTESVEYFIIKTVNSEQSTVDVGNSDQSPPIFDPDAPEWANVLVKSMSLKVSQCKDVYTYACGGWTNDAKMPVGRDTYGVFIENDMDNVENIKRKIDQGNLEGDAERKASTFYKSCVSVHRSNRRKIIGDIKNFLQGLSKNNYKSNQRDIEFQQLIENISSYDVWPIFKILSRPDPRNVSKEILTMFSGNSPFSAEHYRKVPNAMSQLRKKNPLQMNFRDKDDDITNDIDKMTSTELVEYHIALNKAIFKYFWDADDSSSLSWLCEYNDYQYCQKSQAKKMAEALTYFEIDILKAMVSHKKSGFQDGNKHILIPVSELQLRCNIMDWKQFFRRIGVMDADEIVVFDDDNIFSVCDVVKEAKTGTTEKRVILQNFLLVAVVKSLLKYDEIQLLRESLDDDDIVQYETNHYSDCIIHTMGSFQLATSSIFLRGSTYTDHIEKVTNIMQYIKESFRTYTLRKSWLDKETQSAAIKKLDNMIDKIGYPEYIKDKEFRDQYYKDIEIGDDFLENVLASRKFKISKMAEALREPSNRNWWVMYPDDVNAEHTPWLNDMTIPVGIMSFPFFDPDRPMALNFGAIGSVIGHELTHAFDTTGQYFNYEGASSDWMSYKSEENFMNLAECFVNQYDKYSVQGYKISGNRTQNENIADNGGIRTSFHAFKLWRNKHPNETDINEDWMEKYQFTDEKLFFLGFSQMYCSIYSDKGLEDLSSHVHSPGPLRVEGTFDNFDAIRNAYGCPVTSDSCVLW